MKKQKLESSARVKRAKKSAKRTSDKDIDFSDIPELTDSQLKSAFRVGGQALKHKVSKSLIAIRIDSKLLSKIQNLAKKNDCPYQTLINELLNEAVKKAA